MKLEDILAQKRSVILKRWFESILVTYPEDAQKFFRNQKNKFSNPVGHIIGKELEGLWDQVLTGGDKERVSAFLERIIKIRAVQDFAPSQALDFVFQLKRIVREELGPRGFEKETAEELLAFEAKVDDLARLAFDIYSACREKLNQIKLNEERSRVYLLLKRAGMLNEEPEADQKDRVM